MSLQAKHHELQHHHTLADEHAPVTTKEELEHLVPISFRSSNSSARGVAKKHRTLMEKLWPLITCFMVIIWVVVGVVVGMEAEGWTWLTSLYVTTQIITTVGYGDITVSSESMKLFMTFYVMGCLIFLSYVINKFAESMLSRNSNYFQEKIEALQARLDPETPRAKDTWLGKFGTFQHAILNVLLASGGFLFWVGIGTVFYATYEKCTCSYGATGVDGCQEGEMCAQTGGYVKTWVDAYYMSVITLTTVGFGDHTPRSWWGRVFGIVWMVCGVITTAGFVGNMADLFFEGHQDKTDDQIEFTREVFMQMDRKHKGSVTRAEFFEFLLLKYKLVDKHSLMTINKLFTDIDTDGSGTVDIEEVDRQFGVKKPNSGLADEPADTSRTS